MTPTRETILALARVLKDRPIGTKAAVLLLALDGLIKVRPTQEDFDVYLAGRNGLN